MARRRFARLGGGCPGRGADPARWYLPSTRQGVHTGPQGPGGQERELRFAPAAPWGTGGPRCTPLRARASQAGNTSGARQYTHLVGTVLAGRVLCWPGPGQGGEPG